MRRKRAGHLTMAESGGLWPCSYWCQRE